jgi:hypothetical protein
MLTQRSDTSNRGGNGDLIQYVDEAASQIVELHNLGEENGEEELNY